MSADAATVWAAMGSLVCVLGGVAWVFHGARCASLHRH